MRIKRSKAPPVGFLFENPAHMIACGFGSGLSPVASGTAGTLFAWVTFPVLTALTGTGLPMWLSLVAAMLAGAWCCDVTGRRLGEHDHGAIVWDEIVPFWCVLGTLPPAWLLTGWHWEGLLWQTAAFFLFRFYDVTKPQPAKWLDLNVKNGIGVMADDVVAAVYAAVSVNALAWGARFVL